MRPTTQTWTDLVRELPVLGRLRRDLHRSVAGAQPGWFAALSELGDSKGLPVSELAERLHVDVPVASRHMAHLEEAGLVHRERDPHDGRCHLLTLTPAGTQWAARVRDLAQQHVSALLWDWPQEHVATLTSLLARLRCRLAEVDGTVVPRPTPALVASGAAARQGDRP